ncbi:MAG: hypothetical protein Q8N23_27625 [Archangium sp.]|nr:hypothetical protein [Archangium sp.]MDP3571669.1 hypothetical protein [Archangium sp.]
MREVLFRVTQLFSRRAVVAWWVALVTVGIALTWVPLMGQPGYELSAGLTLLLTFAGAGLAITSARAHAGPLASAVLLALSTVPALLVATLRTRFGTPCDPFAGVAFVPLLILPTAGLVSIFGALAVYLTPRRWLAAALYAGLIVLTAVSTAWPLIAGPQVFAFNHLGGYLPGPLYDEELSVPASLLWFRLATVLLAVGVGALLQRKHKRGALLLTLFAAIELGGTPLGFRMTDAALAEALGGVVETDELILHYPSGLSDQDVSRVLGDVRFRHHQITAFFGAPPPGKVKVWLYRSAEEKQRLVGAAHTQFAKPWRREVHVNGLGFPHPVIKHELVHAMAAPWGAPPFGVTASLGGLSPHVGVIEGFAVAADNPVDDLSLHEWAAAMKKKELLPPVASLMTPQGFYGAPPSRAYTTAGSFLRFLGEQFGKEKLRSLYRDGDFERAFGEPLPALAAKYETFLDGVPLLADAVNQAFGRFRRGSLFERPCAREVGRLAAEAGAAIASDPQRARDLLARCRALQPDEPSHALAEAHALRRLSQEEASRALLDSELDRLEGEPAPWAEAALTRADLAQEEGDLATAETLWRRVVERQISPTMERTSQVRINGLGVEAVHRYFQPGEDDVKLFFLREASEAHPEAWSVRYLMGRKLQLAGESGAALPVLEKLLAQELPPAVAKETTRLTIEAAFALGRCDTLAKYAAPGRFGAAFDARAADWVERCAFAW